jgi:hypothetical protein
MREQSGPSRIRAGGSLYQLGAPPATVRRAHITQAGHRGRRMNGVNADKSNFAAAAALLLVLAASALPGSSGDAAPTANKAFTVGNYPVEAQAKNAVAAKEKAHAEGQQAAFRSLLKRIVPVTAYNRMDRLKTANAGDYIDGVAVRSERNSSTEYIAALDFSFKADQVRNLLRREGVPFIDEQAPKAVLIPVMRETSADGAQPAAGSSEFRAASAPWSEAWKGLDLDNTLTPLKIEPLLPAVPPGVIQTLLSGGSGAMNDLADQYKSDNILIAVAEIDTSMKRLHVTLAGDDAVGPLLWRRDYRLTDNDVSYAMELAAVVTLGVLEGRWKAAKSEAFGGVDAVTGPGSEVLVQVEFSSLSEWNELRRQIVDTPGVDDVQIGAVSARSAEVTLRYPGGGQPLANTLARQGLSLRSEGQRWLLRASFQ